VKKCLIGERGVSCGVNGGFKQGMKRGIGEMTGSIGYAIHHEVTAGIKHDFALLMGKVLVIVQRD